MELERNNDYLFNEFLKCQREGRIFVNQNESQQMTKLHLCWIKNSKTRHVDLNSVIFLE